MRSIEQRVESFFLLATLYDAENECLKEDAKNHAISDLGIWKDRMDYYLDWLHENSTEVLLNLANLRKKWPACCEALEEILYSETIAY